MMLPMQICFSADECACLSPRYPTCYGAMGRPFCQVTIITSGRYRLAFSECSVPKPRQQSHCDEKRDFARFEAGVISGHVLTPLRISSEGNPAKWRQETLPLVKNRALSA